jgi:hypothetical protein
MKEVHGTDEVGEDPASSPSSTPGNVEVDSFIGLSLNANSHVQGKEFCSSATL